MWKCLSVWLSVSSKLTHISLQLSTIYGTLVQDCVFRFIFCISPDHASRVMKSMSITFPFHSMSQYKCVEDITRCMCVSLLE